MGQLEQEVAKAREAKGLKSSILDDFFEKKGKTLWLAFQEARIGDIDTLVQLHTQLKSLNALKMELLTIENSGKLAEFALEKERNK